MAGWRVMEMTNDEILDLLWESLRGDKDDSKNGNTSDDGTLKAE